jgi:arabinofuranan 3-O-arabinosyltransferase
MTDEASPADEVNHAANVVRRVGGGVALIAAAFVQAPGQVSPDTKLDLAVDPSSFLARAWDLWEPLGAFGQLQNQAYGYFLPMGPFFVLGHLAHLPPWVTQRAWWALLLGVAYVGVLVLADRLRIGTPGTRLLAALAFALSPRAVTELGGISVELWPSAIAPWVLVPLVAVRPGAERRAAARSALAVALAGGVNAVAVGATLPLAVVWFVTSPAGRLRRRLAGWWALFVPAAIAWWLGPLVVLGRYSPAFLDWIESSAVTTSVASVANALRGTTHWVAWLRGPLTIWPAGTSLVSSVGLGVLGWIGVLLALAALFMRSCPHRRFLVGGVVVGVALVTAGHVGGGSPPWAPLVQHLLDEPGAALRNTHKFDVLIRLPLALALAHSVAAIRLSAAASVPGATHALRVMAASAVVGTAVPVLAGQLPARGTFPEVPRYWAEAANWLEAHDDGGRTLVVPGSPFATSVWGDSRDEPLQALARTPWAVRNVVPLSSAGNIRFLTAVEQQLTTGRGSPGLAAYLARAGVTRLLVRADLAGVPVSTPRPATVRSTLTESGGFVPVARFGPDVGGERWNDAVVDDGVDVAVPALQVWRVVPPSSRAELWEQASAVRVAGGPESLLTLADAGLLDGRATTLDGDPEATALAAAPLVLTDGPQRREATFSSVRDVYSAPLAADAPWATRRVAHDWTVFDSPQVVADYLGIDGVEASSQAGAVNSAWAAVDGDPATSWRAQWLDPGRPWWQVRFRGAVLPPPTISVRPGVGAGVTAVDVVTEAGRRRSTMPGSDTVPLRPVSVPSGPTRWLRIEIVSQRPSTVPEQPGLQEVLIPGVQAQRPLRLPEPSGTPVQVVLRTSRDGTDGCVFPAGRPSCGSRLAEAGEEDRGLDRLVTLPGSPYLVTARARPQATPALDRLLAPSGDALVAAASSRRSAEPAERPQSLVDSDDSTAWVAAPTDAEPSFTLTWRGRRTVSALRIQTEARLAASRAARIRVSTSPSGTGQEVAVDARGWARFTPLDTERLTVTVVEIRPEIGYDPSVGRVNLPFGANEIVVPALDDLRRPVDDSVAVPVPCGSGPPLVLTGRVVPTRVAATYGALLHRQAVDVVPCTSGPVDLPAGTTRVTLRATDAWRPESVRLVPTGVAALRSAARPVAATVRVWDADSRVLDLPARRTQTVLVVHENLNAGWRATLGGRVLSPVRIDGWQQGWIVPAGPSGTVRLTFVPNGPYRVSLVGGAVLLLWVAAMAFGSRGRLVPASGPPSAPALAAMAVVLVAAGGWIAAVCLLLAFLLSFRGHRAVAVLGMGGAIVAAVVAVPVTAPPGDTVRDTVVAAALWWALSCAVVQARENPR